VLGSCDIGSEIIETCIAIDRWRQPRRTDFKDEPVAAIAASIRVRLTMLGFERVSPRRSRMGVEKGPNTPLGIGRRAAKPPLTCVGLTGLEPATT